MLITWAESSKWNSNWFPTCNVSQDAFKKISSMCTEKSDKQPEKSLQIWSIKDTGNFNMMMQDTITETTASDVLYPAIA